MANKLVTPDKPEIVKPHISQSQLVTMERCGEQYRRRYLEHDKVPPGIAMLKGIGAHEGAKANFMYKKKKKKDMRAKDIVEIAVETFKQKLKKGFILTKKEEGIGQKKVKGTSIDIVKIFSQTFAKEVAPMYMPKYVEEKFTIEIPGCSYNLVGILDLADTRNNVIDFKFTSKRKNQYEADYNEQLSFYALIYKALTGQVPRKAILENITAKGERNPLFSSRNIDDIKTIIYRLNMMISSIKNGIFMPTSPTNWWCSEAYCGYFRTCKYIKNREE